MKAKIHSYNLDINYKCPSCNLFFRLINGEIPTKHKISKKCEGCGKLLMIDPVSVDLHVPKKKAVVSDKNTIAALKILGSMGCTAKQANDAIRKAMASKAKPASAGDLAKLALSFLPGVEQ